MAVLLSERVGSWLPGFSADPTGNDASAPGDVAQFQYYDWHRHITPPTGMSTPTQCRLVGHTPLHIGMVIPHGGNVVVVVDVVVVDVWQVGLPEA
jgi:hypothetical protein